MPNLVRCKKELDDQNKIIKNSRKSNEKRSDDDLKYLRLATSEDLITSSFLAEEELRL